MIASATIAEKKAKAAPPAPPRSKWHAFGNFLCWQLVAILFVEFALMLAGLGEEEIFRFDPALGFRHMPNKRITWRTEGFAQSYLDGDGMREPGLTVAKPANTYRVAFLGDSMVEGFQVPIEQTFCSVAAKELGEVGGKKIQSLDFGISGYSTAQEYLQLKDQVMKYQPDLVVLCYNSRDMFENWTAPDQVITNVRPAAVHLPGGSLFIDNSQVMRWFNTPRAKFLRATDWVRQNSRIYGLFAAIDLEWSQKNPWYRAFIDTLAKPKRGFEEFQKLLATEKKKGPSFSLGAFEAATKPARKPAHSKTVVASASPTQQVLLRPHATMPETSYTKVVTQTLDSLISEMRKECTTHGARFAVVALPVRAQLCPLIGMETAFGTIDYAQELDALSKICARQDIPYSDVEATAEGLPLPKRESLFYAVHLTPDGHQYIADAIAPLIKGQLANTSGRRDPKSTDQQYRQ